MIKRVFTFEKEWKPAFLFRQYILNVIYRRAMCAMITPMLLKQSGKVIRKRPSSLLRTRHFAVSALLALERKTGYCIA